MLESVNNPNRKFEKIKIHDAAFGYKLRKIKKTSKITCLFFKMKSEDLCKSSYHNLTVSLINYRKLTSVQYILDDTNKSRFEFS